MKIDVLDPAAPVPPWFSTPRRGMLRRPRQHTPPDTPPGMVGYGPMLHPVEKVERVLRQKFDVIDSLEPEKRAALWEKAGGYR